MNNPRLNRVLQYINQVGFATTNELSEAVGVSLQTIRRDIRILSDQNLINKYHGGVAKLNMTATSSEAIAVNDNHIDSISSLPESTNNQEQRENMQKQLALEVVKHIKDGSSVFIAIGTTMEAIAHELACKKELTIFTNSLTVANIIYKNTDFDVIIPGGTVQRRNAGLVDRETESFVQEISVDYLLFTCGGFEESGNLLGFYLQEIHILKMLLERSSHSFLVIDSGKLNKSAPIRITNLSEISSLFIDNKPSEGILKIAKLNNVGVYIPEK
ncbi:DeoR/GlpR family DNA-binding transcription regulator [Endozoicomonas elysicola]|uniref:HTH deoR-type domain-containing protein n=1 Tax=Endozoicomonas elysicola TaxID=305900 RepID=A0A081KFQ0_9GAMM|nr:DeoR/GlpR family DNA-binding transcription regulator [Endozoicomonas elysicola]KEI72976.1 hypothetical protein GV64_21650 [Endozoicomonas elysicola]